MATPNPNLTESDVLGSPAWLPLRFQDKRLEFVRLDESAYRAASFLDERLLHAATPLGFSPRAVWQAATARLPPCRRFIFHTGHVGSTLLSRLLGEHAALFALREPAILRATVLSPTIPGDPDAATLGELARLLGRSWRPGQEAVVKTTSVLNESAATLMALHRDSRAVLMWAQPLNYIRGILAGPNSRIESRTLAPLRLGRLARRISEFDVKPHTEGEQVAMSWLSEMMTLHDTGGRYHTRTRWLDFDAFLATPIPHLSAVLTLFGAATTDAEVAGLAHSPIMARYSKAPEHAYDAALRVEVLQSADWQHGAEIRRGMAWLERAFNDSRSARALTKTLPL